MGNSTDQPVHDAALHARRASSFGAAAAAYAEHRPDYPADGIRWALEPLGGKEKPKVLDLGAGTGKLTEGLLSLGFEVTAVEPDEAMLAELAGRYPAATALTGTAESIPLPDGAVDAVVVGQAFHWFDQQRALPEIARVLRPGGVLAALWNTDDLSVDWVAELQRVSRSDVSAPMPPQREEAPMPTHPLFGDFESTEVSHVQRRTAESLTATIGTQSHTLVISPQERAELLGRIADYLRGRPETAAGEFDLPIVTLVIRSVLR
ncbi:class I SAM-dependent methyltransferase [Solihabitans fulvus]|uniref:Class I SAM-dependent methyltransferase n=1 Tax=Solihabitans fulvus TaxID=1892852 RepID=A0A5B2XET5_9PSEU|nr:class I SAM-dependent methyltransferase [Solihabitans fulvus]KAA2262318.1 class I SAM-dependent methyltransferase [Solihabitans fulvus]